MAKRAEVIRALPRRLSQMFWFVAMSPHGVSNTQIFDHLYGDDPEGGPLTGVKNIWVYTVYLNRHLAQCGLVIRKEQKHKHWALYCLRQLDNGNIWMPFAHD